MYNVLIIGSGGREHAIAWSIAKDEKVSNVFCAPGNAGTELIAENLNIDISDNNSVLKTIDDYNIDYTIIGPENPLENGLVDCLEQEGKKVFGPCKYAAQLETSKLFARYFMEKYNIPQPSFFECISEEEVISVSTKLGFPIVLKADGLAAGKGVIICNNIKELESAMDIMFTEQKFGKAGNKLSVEECLKGEELSVFVVSDGNNYKILNSAQDHKRIFENDEGPNTGGMGAYCPTPLFDKVLKKKVEDRIIRPTIDGMKKEDSIFKGFLYVGLMIVDNEPYVIEFNTRMGDPETQAVLPMINTSLFDILVAAINEDLDLCNIEVNSGFAVTVVLAAEGYPDSYPKGMKITGIENVSNSYIFHSGTINKDNVLMTHGGRVLNVVSVGDTLCDAINQTYEDIQKIYFDNMYFRRDIGEKGLRYIKKINE